jgi:hypothetical protein
VTVALLSACLVQGRAEINNMWPGRPRASDGWIGDTAHQAQGWPATKHMPNPRGYVHAIDVTWPGIDVARVISAFQAVPHSYLWIFNGQIALKREGWRRRVYTGTSPHREHIHLEDDSSEAAEHDSSPWGLASQLVVAPIPAPSGQVSGSMVRMPVLYRTSQALAATRIAQRVLIAYGYPVGAPGVDGVYGGATEAAVRHFQRDHPPLATDGVVGAHTWCAFMQAVLGGLTVDGQLGPATAARIRAVQAAHNLSIDGVFGPRSWAATLP